METLVEFRAGLMAYSGGMLKPDGRKGLIRLAVDDSGLNHVLWLERGPGGALAETGVDQIIALPGEAVFEKVGGVAPGVGGGRGGAQRLPAPELVPEHRALLLQINRPGARVFILKFPEDSSRNLFFWAQVCRAGCCGKLPPASAPTAT